MKLTKLTAGLLTGCTMLASVGGAMAQDQDPVSATMIIYLDPSVQFFNPVVKGAQDAADRLAPEERRLFDKLDDGED